MPLQGIGYHTLFDFFDCDSDLLNNLEALKTLMLQAARASGATIIGEYSHRFNPYGISSMIILAESHLSLHTWPEYHFAAADLFSCNPNIDAQKAGEVLKSSLKPKSCKCSLQQRGQREL